MRERSLIPIDWVLSSWHRVSFAAIESHPNHIHLPCPSSRPFGCISGELDDRFPGNQGPAQRQGCSCHACHEYIFPGPARFSGDVSRFSFFYLYAVNSCHPSLPSFHILPAFPRSPFPFPLLHLFFFGATGGRLLLWAILLFMGPRFKNPFP